MRKVAVLCAGLLGLALLVGCGSDESGSGAGAPDSTAAPAVSPPGLREQGAPAPSDNDQAPTTTRKEVVTGDVALIADDPIAAAGVIADRVRELDGRVDSRTEQPRTDDDDGTGYRPRPQGPSATLTVRVPSDRTDAFVDGLGQVGRLTRVSLNRADVTMQWEDQDARIKALQTSVDRLRALIAGATSTADLLAAEQALSSRQGELDSLTAQQRLLNDQVALSTLSISVTTPAANPEDDDEPTSFWGGLVAGWKGLVGWLGDAVVVTGKALPSLVFLAVLGGLILAVVRFARRRRGGPGTAQAPGKAWAEPEQAPSNAAPAAARAESATDRPAAKPEAVQPDSPARKPADDTPGKP